MHMYIHTQGRAARRGRVCCMDYPKQVYEVRTYWAVNDLLSWLIIYVIIRHETGNN